MSLRSAQGFSLIEMLIAMSVSSLLVAAVVSLFSTQRRVYAIREQVAEMQQDARAGMDFMVREITMAGYDPTGNAAAGIVTAEVGVIRFTMDLNGDRDTADPNEEVTYTLSDTDGDGDPDLCRDPGAPGADGGGPQLIAENVLALAFVYRLADGTATSETEDFSQIRGLDVSLTVRTAKPDPHYAANNGHRTRVLTTRIQIRNLGL
jgi:type IV pilus assembly protein PilW